MSFRADRWIAFILLLSGLPALAGCGLLPGLSSTATPAVPEFTNHPPLILPAVDNAPFLSAGCKVDGSWLRCPVEGAFAASNCTVFLKDATGLGGLGSPLILCREHTPSRDIPAGDYLYNDGCSLPMYVRMILWRDGGLKALRGQADLRAAFTPVDSPEEALSYAIASTGYDPQYGLAPEAGFRYAAKTIEDTYVKAEGSGYRVHLFYSKVCGCGPHPVFAADVLVGRDGSVQVEKLGEMLANSKYDGMCVD